jgi:hypothetical protein
MEKIDVKYNNIVVGYTYDEGKTVIFLDNEAAKEIQSQILNGYTVGVSSRRMGVIKEDNHVDYKDITEYGLINFGK